MGACKKDADKHLAGPAVIQGLRVFKQKEDRLSLDKSKNWKDISTRTACSERW